MGRVSILWEGFGLNANDWILCFPAAELSLTWCLLDVEYTGLLKSCL